MVIDETIAMMQERYGRCLKEITIERLVVGIFFTGVRLSNGRGGICYTPASEIHRDHDPVLPFPGREKPGFAGVPVGEVLSAAGDGPLLTTVRLVLLNALSEPILSTGIYTVIDDCDALDIIDLARAKRVAMVGAIRPFLRRLMNIPDLEIRLFERKKESVSPGEQRFLVPAEEARDVIPLCDTMLLSGAAIANGTIDELLDMASPEATIVVAGPTASFLPDILFEKGVDVVSGAWITSPDRTLDMLGEGLAAIDLFPDCAKKINVVIRMKRSIP